MPLKIVRKIDASLQKKSVDSVYRGECSFVMDQFWDETEPDVMSVVVRVLPSILPSLVSQCKQQFVGGRHYRSRSLPLQFRTTPLSIMMACFQLLRAKGAPIHDVPNILEPLSHVALPLWQLINTNVTVRTATAPSHSLRTSFMSGP